MSPSTHEPCKRQAPRAKKNPQGGWAGPVQNSRLPNGGRGQGAGRQEAGEIRMFPHWATGLRSGLLPEGCGVATPEVGPKKKPFGAKFSRGFGFFVPGEGFLEGFGRFSEVSRMFLQGLAPQGSGER